MNGKILAGALLGAALIASPAMADWSTTVISNGQNAVGQTGQVTCPPGGSPGAIWGTGTYTSDSSICGAAQHYGWIPPGGGGTVTYQTVPGLNAYQGSVQNGITTHDYGSWSLSFQITGFTPSGGGGAPFQPIDWSANIDSLGVATNAGASYQYFCPPSTNAPGSVWGTDLYTSDSSICAAAQHRGLISATNGGPVTVLILGEQPAYTGSNRNGITTLDYPAWPRSYTFQ